MSATLSDPLNLYPRHVGPAPEATGSAAPVTFEVKDQTGHTINNVGGDQHNEHHYRMVIEPMRQRARVLLRLGSGLALSALAVQFAVLALFGSRLDEFVESVRPAVEAGNADPLVLPPFGVLLAIPLAAVVGFLGLVLVAVGASTRRRARREVEAL